MSFDPQNPAPGIFTGVSEDEYHSHPLSVSKSTLKYLDPCSDHVPADALNYMQNGIKETPALLAGRVVELALLEPHRFDAEVCAAKTFTGTGSKARREEWRASVADKIQVASEVYDRAKATRRLLERDHPEVAKALDSRDKQLSMLWQDDVTGEWVRTRPDVASLFEAPNLCWDVKNSSKGLGDKQIVDHLHKYGAAIQAATFREGFHRITGKAFPACYLLLISGTGPVDLKILRVNQDWLQHGAWVYRQALDRYAECKRTGHWPGHIHAGVQDSPKLPDWLDKRERRIQQEAAA